MLEAEESQVSSGQTGAQVEPAVQLMYFILNLWIGFLQEVFLLAEVYIWSVCFLFLNRFGIVCKNNCFANSKRFCIV